MKKIFLLFAVIASVLLAGCSDDKNKDTGSDELVGTKWMLEEGVFGSPYYWAEGIQFKSVSGFTYFYYQMQNLSVVDEGEASGWYIYNPPVITGSITMDGIKADLRGEVNGSKMKVFIDDEFYGVYEKQAE